MLHVHQHDQMHRHHWMPSFLQHFSTQQPVCRSEIIKKLLPNVVFECHIGERKMLQQWKILVRLGFMWPIKAPPFHTQGLWYLDEINLVATWSNHEDGEFEHQYIISRSAKYTQWYFGVNRTTLSPMEMSDMSFVFPLGVITIASPIMCSRTSDGQLSCMMSYAWGRSGEVSVHVLISSLICG